MAVAMCVFFVSVLTVTLCLSSCQELLPATGVPIRPQRFDHNQEFSEYVRSRTLQNWKFWIVSFI